MFAKRKSPGKSCAEHRNVILLRKRICGLCEAHYLKTGAQSGTRLQWPVLSQGGGSGSTPNPVWRLFSAVVVLVVANGGNWSPLTDKCDSSHRRRSLPHKIMPPVFN